MPFAKRKTGRNPLQRLADQRRSLALAGLAAGAVFSAAVLHRRRRAAAPELGPPMPPPVSPPPAQPEPEPPSEPAGPPEPVAQPATGELSAEEASILAVLTQHGRADEDRTALAVATSLEREVADVSSVLRKLSAEGIVFGDLYTALGDKIWSVTALGVGRLGAQH